MTKGFLRRGLIASFAGLIGVVAGMLLLKHPTVEIRSGTMLDAPRSIVDFRLNGANGNAFTNADLADHWTVVFPGYTYCPDVCPTTLALLKTVQAGLGATASSVRFVFLSVDPERDTPEKLANYLHYFSPDFVGVTGGSEQLDRLGASLGYVYTKVPGATPESYLIDHSTALILIGPGGKLRGYLTPPFEVDALIADLKSLTRGNR